MWEDYRIVEAFLQTVASKDSKLVHDETEKLKGLHGTQLGLGRLVAALKEGDGITASMIARGFGKIGPNAEGAVPLLIKGIIEKDDFSIHCLIALGEIGPTAKAAVPTLLELPNGEQDPSIIRLQVIRLQAAFALSWIDPEVEGRHWEGKELRTLPEPVESWGKLTFAGSFRQTNPLPLVNLAIHLVRNRENDPVIMNAAGAKVIQNGDGHWQYNGELEARCPPGTYDLVAVLGGNIQVGQTSVTVIQSKNRGQ